jgi:hypothetical protein
MLTSNPLKRNPALVQFSKDHHFGLLLIWKIRQGLQLHAELQRIGKYINFFFDNYLEEHFKEEEELLFIHLDDHDDLRLSAESDHSELSQLNKKIKHNPDQQDIRQFANLLEQHIRFEERFLFAHLQDNLQQEQLNFIAKKMHASHPHVVEDDWKDVFWLKKSQ